MINEYFNGSTVRLSTYFRDLDGSLTDPDSVTLTYATPAEAETTLTYGVDAALTKDATGSYHADITANRVGLWHYRWNGDDKVQEGKFRVNPSVFYP